MCQCSVYVTSSEGPERLVAVAQGTIVTAGERAARED